MKNFLKNETGVTMIELVVGFAILTIIFTFVFTALLFSQKTVVHSDSKNNEAAVGQDIVDSIVTQLSEGVAPSKLNIPEAVNVGSSFQEWDMSKTKAEQTIPIKQYRIVTTGKGYTVYYRSYYDDGNQINYTAFANKGGVI